MLGNGPDEERDFSGPSYKSGCFATAWIRAGTIQVNPISENDTRSGNVNYTITLRRGSTNGVVYGEIKLDNHPDGEYSRWVFTDLPFDFWADRNFRGFLHYAACYKPKSILRTEGARRTLTQIKEFAKWATAFNLV